MFPSPFTFILTADAKSLFTSFITTYVVPIAFAVTKPSSFTIATFSSNDLNVYLLFGTSFLIKLNSTVEFNLICSCSYAFSKFIVLFSTFIFFLLIHQGVIKLSIVPFPIWP